MQYGTLFLAHSQTIDTRDKTGIVFYIWLDPPFLSCPSHIEQDNFGISFTKIGQLPTDDGLFGELRSAYFMASQLSLTSVRKCVEFVVP
jgi:hypothetical protein